MFLVFRLQARLLRVRDHNNLMKELNRAMMERIRDEYWPKHFQNTPETFPGPGGYGYARRTRKYEEKKFRRFGHRRPLVYTGDLERSVRTSAHVSSTSRKGTLRARSPHFLRVKHRKEIEVVSRREQLELAKWYAREYVRLAHTPRFQSRLLRQAVPLN